MRIHELTGEEALQNLVTSENGLTEEEAHRRLQAWYVRMDHIKNRDVRTQ